MRSGPVRTANAAAHPESHLMQIENFSGPWRAQTNIPGYLGNGFRTSNADGVATTTMDGEVTLARGGRYAVWVRGYEGEGWDRSFVVSIGGQKLTPTHASRTAHGFGWQKAGEVELPPGEVAVRVHDHGTSFEVADAILITNDLEHDPGREERAKRVLPDGAAENLRLVEAVIRQTVASAEAGHARWVKQMTDREAWTRARVELQRRFRETVGLEPPPDRTPLNARILGETQKDGYAVQRLTFESRPGFLVTANVYVPTATSAAQRGQNIADLNRSAMFSLPGSGSGSGHRGRWPAVLCPSGHWRHAKSQEQVQARCAGLAKLGFVALTYDPFGQGERAVDGNGHRECFRTMLAGTCNMSYMLWDTMRAVDYLLTRDDVDPERIACTGASGGGLNTLYVAAIDERIKVAVPVVYATSFREFLGTRHDHCPCSHPPGLAGYADMGTIAALIAPRPMMFITAKQDPSFTPQGAREARDEALPAYRAYGREGDLLLREFDCGHDYNKPMREALYGFVLKHFMGQGDGSPHPEPLLALESPDSPALRCFEGGRVPTSATTVRSLARQDAMRLRERLPRPEEASRTALRKVLGWSAGALPRVADETVRTPIDREGPAKILLRTGDGVALPGLLVGADPGAPTAVLLDPAGAQNSTGSAQAATLSAAGWNLLALDLRGWGETKGREHLLATDSLLWGKPLVTQRAQDLLMAVRHLREGGRLSEEVALVANGASGSLVALVAAAMGGRFVAVVTEGLPDSLLDLYDQGVPPDATVPRLLEVADIPNLRRLGNASGQLPDVRMCSQSEPRP